MSDNPYWILPGFEFIEFPRLAAAADRWLGQLDELIAELSAYAQTMPSPECGRLAWRSEASARYETGLVRLGASFTGAVRAANLGRDALHRQSMHLHGLADAAEAAEAAEAARRVERARLARTAQYVR